MKKSNKILFNYKDVIIISISIFFALIYALTFSYYFTEQNKLTTINNNSYTIEIGTVTYSDQSAIPNGFPSNETREKSFNASVSITAPNSNETYYGSGSIFAEDNEYSYIVTCHHVIRYASPNDILITFYDGTETKATLVGSDPKTDIAVLKILGTGFEKVSFIGSSSDISAGQSAYSIGNSMGLYPFTYTFGSLSQSVERTITIQNFGTFNLLQTDTAINGGMSGGGLFDSNGVMVGMISSGYDSNVAQNINFAIPGYALRNVIEQLMTNIDPETGLGYIPNTYNLELTIGTLGSSKTYPVVTDIPTYSSFFGYDKQTSLQMYDLLKNVKIGDGEVIPLSTSSNMVQIFNDAKDNLNVGTQVVFTACENFGIDDIERTVVVTIKQYVFTL